MNDKQFTDELFKRMYDLGYRKAEIEDDTLFFFVSERDYLCPFSPRVQVKCTCFEEKDQLIDIAEYLGVVDWSKVPVDTPIYVREHENNAWEKRHFLAAILSDAFDTFEEGCVRMLFIQAIIGIVLIIFGLGVRLGGE